jgi:hypothetical protein
MQNAARREAFFEEGSAALNSRLGSRERETETMCNLFLGEAFELRETKRFLILLGKILYECRQP